MVCRFQVEVDKFCCHVLMKHWPNVKRYGDIRDIDWGFVEPIDVLVGGFPCQTVSLAGKRMGIEDERWLWPEFARAIRSLRPRYVIIENVPGLLVPIRRNGRIIAEAPMGEVLGDLATCGYDAEWQVLSAAQFGAPHIRERVFILAYSSEQRCKGAKLQPWYKKQILKTTSQRAFITDSCWWKLEPDVDRMAVRTTIGVDRLRVLGNAIVPQVIEYMGHCIIDFEQEQALDASTIRNSRIVPIV